METEVVHSQVKTISKPKRNKFKTLKIAIRKDWQLYSLLILPIIYLLIFKYGPMFGNVIAFRRYMPGGKIYGEQWVGLYYFQMFIEDPVFWNVF
ncbi:hypothetical protein SIN57_001945, partial [Campylobacter upsaliensis]|nr:hypothetical protein [Campylobacter upsaliensis]